MNDQEVGSLIHIAPAEVFRRVVDSVRNYAIFALTPDGCVASWNLSAERVKGWSEKDVIGRYFSVFYRPEDIANGVPEKNLRTAEREGLFEEEGFRMKCDGTVYPVHASLSSIRGNDGELHGFVKVLEDRTEHFQRSLELESANCQLAALVAERTLALAESVAQLGTSTYTIVHELRAPARAMQTYADILLTDYPGRALDADGVRYLARIKSAAARMDRLIVDILTVTCEPPGDLKFSEVDLDLLVDDLLGQCESIKATGAVVSVGSPLGTIRAHEATVAQCLSILFRNAVVFAQPGKRPAIRVWRTDEPDGPRLWIADSGVGRRPEHRVHTWSSLEQTLGSTHSNNPDAGLAVLERSMHRLGGSVGVRSRFGEGSTFFLQFGSELVEPVRPSLNLPLCPA